MFASPPPTKEDLRREAIIQHKQRVENERKARIFNPRNRVIGLDCSGLARQLAEKKERNEYEQQIECKHVAEEQKRLQLLNQKANELQRERHQIERDMNEFRLGHQRKEQTREFDLNDPEYKRKSRPARIGDDDPRLTISSAQKFQGEDIDSSERLRLQQAQQRAWLQQQMHEKNQAKSDENEANRMLINAMATYNQRSRDVCNANRNLRKEVHTTTAEYNRALAEEQRGRRERERRQEENDDRAEMYNNLTSEMLLESKELAGSNFGGRRKLVTMYKGMTDDELAAFERQKQLQLEEQKKIESEKRVEKERFDNLVKGFDRIAVLKDHQQRRDNQKQAANDLDENLLLAREQEANKTHLEKSIYTNEPTAEYFAQFNTTSR